MTGMKSNRSMTLGSYLTSVFCTICSAEIRTEGGCKNQNSKIVCNEQAATCIKDTLWWFLFADTRGTGINSTSDAQHPWKKFRGQGLKLDSRHLKHAYMSLTFQESLDQLFQDRFLSIYCEDSETTDHIPDHSWQPKGLTFTSCRWSFLMWFQVQLQAPTSPSQVPKTFRENERLGRANSGLSGSFISRDGHILVQRTLHRSRIPLFGQRSLSKMKGQRQQCLKTLKSFIKDRQSGPEKQLFFFFF